MSRLRTLLAAFCVVSFLLLSTLNLSAQKITGDITGTVTDSSGAALTGAKVTAENTGTTETATVTTNDTGYYRLLNLPPGVYKLSATAPGFKTTTRQAQVAMALVTSADFSMQPGGVEQTVNVEAAAPLIETEENRLSTLIENRRIEELPLNGRDFNSLLVVVPGVQRSPGGGFLSVNINGQRSTANNYAVDGIPNNDRYYGESAMNQTAILGTAATLVPLEGLTEFNVQSNPSAEYGVRGGSVVNVGLKSGTNTFHGSLFWTRHTDTLDARNWFTQPTENPRLRLNQYGLVVGGPIIKDKTFFYTSYQRFELASTFPYTAPVPTPTEINDAMACVATGGGGCLLGTPGPGSDMIFGTADDGTPNSIGTALLGLYPVNPTGELFIAIPNTVKVNNFHVKIDHIFNQNHRISGKYLFGDSANSSPAFAGTLPGGAGLPQDFYNSVAPSRAQLAGINYSWTISPTKILESRIGWTRFSQIIDVNNKIDPASLGINTGPLDPADFGVPAIYYMGYFGYVGGVLGYPITTRPDSSYDWQEHFTWVKGKHTMKMGGQFQNAYTKSVRNRARTEADVAFTDDHVLALQQLLLGYWDGASRFQGSTYRRIHQNSFGVYFQDSWKINPSFTLEYGVRYDISGALGEDFDNGANFLPDSPLADPGGLIPGFVPLSAQPLYAIDKDNWGPRIAFAWDITGKGRTVLRGGYNMNYDVPNFGTIHAPQVTGAFGPGARLGLFTQIPQGNFGIDTANNPQPTPSNNIVTFGGNPDCFTYLCVSPGVDIYGGSVTPTAPYTVMQIVPDFQTPRLQNYNLSLQQQVTKESAVTLSYVGSRASDLPAWRDLNAAVVGSGVSGCDRDASRAFDVSYAGTLCHVIQLNNDGHSNYNSLQASYQLRSWHRLSGQVNFVWSRTFDTGSANRGSSASGVSPCQNPYNVDCNYAPADFDVPINFNFSLVYDVPTVRGLPRLIGEGWQLNTIFVSTTGRPFTPFVGFDESGQGLSYNRAQYLGGPLNYNYSNVGQFFDTTQFVDPTPGTIGNAGRNMLRGPNFRQWDASIFKNFQFSERYKLQFRWEVFNVLNHPNFSIRTGNSNSGSFGRFRETADVAAFNPVLGSGAQRNMQFGVKFIF
ncbi:MAG: TonB-dependent receptor [Candidatus Koribacter versatilis]|uniref:TonB-dependent receptor n=1 Tax=Candidatus Korobacter versatilis TaxID=658062 RepID=A0A932ENZ3_9BACT|nr:TonB-dependent receptor [Candidatus Koribacter versatilis]